MAQFRSDVSGFLEREIIDAAVDAGIVVRPPIPGVTYFGHVDVSGGAHDSFTVAIAHGEGDGVILDSLFERRAPFNPVAVTAEVAALLRSYRLLACEGDRYSAGWVVEAFAREGITYRHAARDRSAIYLDALPLFTAGRARLLDHPRCAAQLAGLERKVSAAGRDRVEPGPLHDDLGISCAGALVAAASQPAEFVSTMPYVTSGRDGMSANDFDPISGARLVGTDRIVNWDPPAGW
jgi:hypothetical protein